MAASRRPRSWRRGSSSDMAEVLVLVEQSGGVVKKVTAELLTVAARLGTPAAVWAGPGVEAGRGRLAEFGAAKVYVADSADFADYVVAPKAELLASSSLPPPRPRC